MSKYEPYLCLGYIAKHINSKELIIQIVLDEPKIFRDITIEFIDKVLEYTCGKLNIDYIMYSSVNTHSIFAKVLDAINLTDNIVDSEYYQWFISLGNDIYVPQSYLYHISNCEPDNEDRLNEEKFIIYNMILELGYAIKGNNMVTNLDIFKARYEHLLT